MFDWVLSIFLLLSPIIFMPLNGYSARFQWYQFGYYSGSISLLQLQFFQYGVVFLFLTALFSKPKRLFQDKLLGMLFAFCVLGVFLHPKTIQNFHNLFLGFILYWLVVTYTKNVKKVLRVVAIVALINTIFAVLQLFNIQITHFPKAAANSPNIIGLMSYKSQLGIYQALAIPICYSLNPYLSIIPLIGLLLSKSVTAIIPVIVGIVYLFRKRLSRVMNCPFWMCFFISLAVLFIRSFDKLWVRFSVWKATLKMIAENPFRGYGIGVFNYVNYKKMGYTDPYSVYLGVAHALGIIGFIVLALFLINKLRGLNRASLTLQGLFASCLILVLCGLTYSFMDYPRLAGTAIVFFGLLTAMKGAQSENQV